MAKTAASQMIKAAEGYRQMFLIGRNISQRGILNIDCLIKQHRVNNGIGPVTFSRSSGCRRCIKIETEVAEWSLRYSLCHWRYCRRQFRRIRQITKRRHDQRSTRRKIGQRLSGIVDRRRLGNIQLEIQIIGDRIVVHTQRIILQYRLRRSTCSQIEIKRIRCISQRFDSRLRWQVDILSRCRRHFIRRRPQIEIETHDFIGDFDNRRFRLGRLDFG
jgi:hypothetical protein